VRSLPAADPGRADARSPVRLLLWIAGRQWPTMAGGAAWGIVGMVLEAAIPALVGRAVDEGVRARDMEALVLWAGLVAAAGVGQAAAGIMRHRFAVTNWLGAAYRVQQLVVRHSGHLGAALPRRLATGEVVAVGSTDVEHIGGAMDITARAAGAVVSFLVVGGYLLTVSVPYGLVVLLGAPLAVLLAVPLLLPLHRRQGEQRALLATVNALAADAVGGLRVLRGVGGEQVFLSRFAAASQHVRRAGVRVARVQTVVDAGQVLLPGLFVVLATWLGARLAVEGRLTPGQLVSFYAYAAFLVLPLRTLVETANKYTRAHVAAGRTIALLALQPDVRDAAAPRPGPALPPPSDAGLEDPVSGVRARPGELTAVACTDTGAATALADRLGRFVDAARPGDAVRLGGVPLPDLPLEEVRRRVLVSDVDPRLFDGSVREALDPTRRAHPRALAAAVAAASADDVLDALPHGLDTQVGEKARRLSGGQRQRLVLARALLADPEVLVLVEPTSAVDAHTEARIAARLPAARAGRATVVLTTSPLVLEHADRVLLVRDGRVAAEGRHRELLAAEPAYLSAVSRDADERTPEPV